MFIRSHSQALIAVQYRDGQDTIMFANDSTIEPGRDTANFAGAPSIATTVLVVDDDNIVRAIIIAGLERAGYVCIEATDIASGWAQFTKSKIDLAIIDVNLPDGSGFALAARMRRRRAVGLIHLTSRGASDDRILGLEGGADDYIVKPVDLRELVARVQAVLRRTSAAPDPLILIGDWTLDLVRRELLDPNGAPLRLTRGEFDLLAALAQAGGVALSRDYLMEVVSSVESGTGGRTIDVLISRIRAKLVRRNAPAILTVKGEGYRLVGPNG